MNSTLSKVQREFCKHSLYPSLEWLSQCLENVLSHPSFSSLSSDINKLSELILLHFLHYDLVISSYSSSPSVSSSIIKLPTSLSFDSNFTILQNEWCLVQIEGIYNISISKHKGKNSSITSTEVNEEEREEDEILENDQDINEEERELNKSILISKNNEKDTKSRVFGNMNKLLITDGFTQCVAYDLENIFVRIASKLRGDISIGLGTKLLISKVSVRHGSLLLSNSTKVLGGRSDYKELRKQNMSDNSLFLDFDKSETLLSMQNTESHTNLSTFLSTFNQPSLEPSTSKPPVSLTLSSEPPLVSSTYPSSAGSSTSFYSMIKKSSEIINNDSSLTPLENEHPIYQEEFYNSTATPFVNKITPVNLDSHRKASETTSIKNLNDNLRVSKVNKKEPDIIDICKSSSSSSNSSSSTLSSSNSTSNSTFLSPPISQNIFSPSKLVPITNKLYYFSDILDNKKKFVNNFFYIHAYPIKLLKNKIEFNEDSNSYSYNIILLYSDGEKNQIIKLSNNLCSSYLGLSPLEYKQVTQNDESKIKKVLRKFQSFSGIFKARLLTEEDKEESYSASSKSRDPTFLFLELSNNAILEICREVL